MRSQTNFTGFPRSSRLEFSHRYFMPIPDAFQLIITRLIQATDERAVSWSEGPASLSYSTSLSSFSVTVQSMRPQGAGTAAFNAGQFNIQFSAVDSDGQ